MLSNKTWSFTWRMLLIATLLPGAANAAPIQIKMQVSSGTGFFVMDSRLVTNEHVLSSGCKKIKLKKNGQDWADATILAIDKEHDLALLESSKLSPQVAYLRSSDEIIDAGDTLMLLGYPISQYNNGGHYKVVQTKLLEPYDSRKTPDVIHYESVSEHGNSGGPILNNRGNVVGVVRRILTYYQTDTYSDNQSETHVTAVVDEGIGLATLEKFLFANATQYQIDNLYSANSDFHIEETAKDFVVNVQCIVSETVEPVGNTIR